jgi:hypothetical protein
LTKNKLPLDPFDPETPLSVDYKRGQLALVAALGGGAVGFFLLITANYSSWTGWAKAIVALLLMFAGVRTAKRLWGQL